MTRSVLALLLLALLAAAPRAAFDEAAFTATVERAMADWQVPGLGVAVVEDGAVVFARGFGTTRLWNGEAVDTTTYFINASTTKAMVAAGLLMLVDDGRVALDDPVIEHLPEIHFGDPALTQQITLRDLLTHRTGLPSTDFWTFNQGMELADQLPRLRAVAPVAPPRARKIYQNTMYELLGLVIERVTDEPWEAFLAEHLWRPIGMKTVASRDAIPAWAAQARPYDVFDGELRRVDHSLRAHVTDAAGSAWSSVDDMVLWIEFLLRGGVTAEGERLLSEASLAEMFRPQQLVAEDDYYPTAELTEPNWISYGLGWYQQDFLGRKVDYHTGSLNGAVAIVGLDRAARRGVVVMANRGGAELRHALLWSVMDDREGAGRPDWHADVLALYAARAERRAERRAATVAGRLDVPPSLPLEAYTGRYDSLRGGPLSISPDGDALRLDTLVRTYRLTPWHADTFRLMHEDWENGSFARFSLTPEGTIDGVEAFGIDFERVDHEAPH
ncbi:MAG: serine hydrolase [Pseudomonadales bacterium]|jgi:CubicO group peptidase (beta-lactamase class C family)|nr:serine hydrolase [Pseudomonadales bacterium]